MSTLAVDTITKADGSGALTVPAESGTVVTTASPSLGRRNLIINGAMQVAQRGTSATGATSIQYDTVDRFRNGVNALGTWTNEQSTDAPNGFSNSFKMTCTAADASLASGDYARIITVLEGQDLQGLAFGTSDAKKLTVSFWIKSNKTGTFSSLLRNTDAARTASSLVTINSADTWEYKTVTFEGDTTGSIDNDNGGSFQVQWWFNAGSTYSGGLSSTTWAAQSGPEYYGNGTLDLGGAVNDYVALTGVQLEVGSVASSYEHRSYGEELALCQRYYLKSLTACIGRNTNGYGENSLMFPVQMRATPSMTGDVSSAGASNAVISSTNDGLRIYALLGSTATDRYGYNTFEADAEL